MHQLAEEERPRGATANAISNAAVRIVREYTGRGPTKAKTIISRDAVTIVFQDTLTKGDLRLAHDGKKDLVLHVRRQFQRTMRDDLVAAVEVNLERKVIAFMSDNHIDPDMAVEVFVLEPHAADEAQPSE
jgi:uncharacterized protein YbcI